MQLKSRLEPYLVTQHFVVCLYIVHPVVHCISINRQFSVEHNCLI
jgi:hypothetical protein